MEPGPTDQPAEDAQQPDTQAQPEEQPNIDMKDVVGTEFMKDLVGQLGLDIEQDNIGDLLGEEEKQEEEKKDDDNKDGGDAAGGNK